MAALLLAGAMVGGCDPAPVATVPAPDYERFRDKVYPILLRDCGFTTCHGDPQRFFHMFGPGRLRLDLDTGMLDPATEEEIEISYERTRYMLLNSGEILKSPLLSKPLEGAGHDGLDEYGRNVYAGPDEPSFQLIEAWAASDGVLP